jgi:hypothetical protein
MTTARNAPCPAEAVRRFKRCCASRGRDRADEIRREERVGRDAAAHYAELPHLDAADREIAAQIARSRVGVFPRRLIKAGRRDEPRRSAARRRDHRRQRRCVASGKRCRTPRPPRHGGSLTLAVGTGACVPAPKRRGALGASSSATETASSSTWLVTPTDAQAAIVPLPDPPTRLVAGRVQHRRVGTISHGVKQVTKPIRDQEAPSPSRHLA